MALKPVLALRRPVAATSREARVDGGGQRGQRGQKRAEERRVRRWGLQHLWSRSRMTVRPPWQPRPSVVSTLLSRAQAVQLAAWPRLSGAVRCGLGQFSRRGRGLIRACMSSTTTMMLAGWQPGVRLSRGRLADKEAAATGAHQRLLGRARTSEVWQVWVWCGRWWWRGW